MSPHLPLFPLCEKPAVYLIDIQPFLLTHGNPSKAHPDPHTSVSYGPALMSFFQFLHASEAAQSSMLLFRRRPYVIGCSFFVLFIISIYELYPSSLTSRHDFTNGPHNSTPFNINGGFNGTWNWQRDGKNFLLNEEQCEQAFPGLFDEVKRAVKDREGNRITLEEVDGIEPVNGYVRAMIYEHEARITLALLLSRSLASKWLCRLCGCD